MPDYIPETILKLEFERLREMSVQLAADRVKAVQFYSILAGGLGIAALVLVEMDAGRAPSVADIGAAIGPSAHMPGIVFALIFWAIALSGLFTLLHLIRLRQAGRETMCSMNRIKEFYVLLYPQLSNTLTWRPEAVPALIRIGSTAFNQTLFVALVDSLAAGAGFLFLGLSSSVPPIGVATGAAALALFWQALVYFWMLRER